MGNLKTKKIAKELNKIKKTKKKLLNTFSLDKLSEPLTNAYQNFKKKTKTRNRKEN